MLRLLREMAPPRQPDFALRQKSKLDMGAADATLDQGGGAYLKGIVHMSLFPRHIKASDARSYVKSTTEETG